MKIELSGFDDLQRQLQDAEKAAEGLKGELGQLQFDPTIEAEVNRAIAEMEKMVDQRFAPYQSNPFITPFIDASKQAFRRAILQKAAGAQRSGIESED